MGTEDWVLKDTTFNIQKRKIMASGPITSWEIDGETVENSERDGNNRPPNLPLEKSVCMSGSNS